MCCTGTDAAGESFAEMETPALCSPAGATGQFAQLLDNLDAPSADGILRSVSNSCKKQGLLQASVLAAGLTQAANTSPAAAAK